MTVAALYVDPKGVYSGLPGVECWGLPDRDARLYAGPWPVVGYHSAEERARGGRVAERRLTKAECAATPPAFRDVLLAMARTAKGGTHA